MTDEKLIVDYLERNYTLKASEYSFVFFDKINKDEIIPDIFANTIFLKVFGDFKTDDSNKSLNILNEWYHIKKRTLTEKLYSIFDKTINKEDKSKKTLEKILKKCEGLEYGKTFITNLFLEDYKDKILIPILDNYKLNINDKSGSSAMINDLETMLIGEEFKLIEFSKEYLNKWYSETIIGEKVKDFLSQLVITLGSRNWVVTWIGHGPLSKNKLLNQFSNENEVVSELIIHMYDKWYEEKIIETSEKAMVKEFSVPSLRFTNN